MKAKVSEIFDSIQGEGVYQGLRQLFIRLYGCNLSCEFCDTRLDSYEELETNDLLNRIDEFGENFHSFSFTGGEPLLQADFLKELIPSLKIKQPNFKIYLETNGTLAKELNKIIDFIDIIAMDIKLPSSTGSEGHWQEHREFLDIACAKEVFIKTVICNSTDIADVKIAVDLLREIDKDMPLVLQPNYFQIGYSLGKKIDDFKRLSSEYLSDVRILPQLHKIIGVK